MRKTIRLCMSLVLFAFLCLTMTVGGCDCTAEDVDETAEEMTGSGQVKRFNNIKSDLKGIDQQRQQDAAKVQESTE